MDTGIQIAGNGDYWPVVDEVVALVADLGAAAVIVANRFIRPTSNRGARCWWSLRWMTIDSGRTKLSTNISAAAVISR